VDVDGEEVLAGLGLPVGNEWFASGVPGCIGGVNATGVISDIQLSLALRKGKKEETYVSFGLRNFPSTVVASREPPAGEPLTSWSFSGL